MSLAIMPARNDLPWYRFKITLEGVIYTLRFNYNTRMARWMMDICDASNNALVLGLPVLLERNIAGQYAFTGLPENVFFSTDDTNQGNQPTRLSFGTTHTLWYGDG